MSNSTYFIQECPTCGRRLYIRVKYLGKRLQCQHCHGQFEAIDSTIARCDSAQEGSDLLRRADELLRSAEQRNPELRSLYPR